MIRRIMQVVVTSVLVMLALVSFAAADESDVNAGTNSYQVVIEASHEAEGDAVTAVSSAGAGAVTYSYEPACIRGEGISGDGYYGCGEQLECGRRGHVFNVFAHHPDGTIEALGSQCFRPSEAPAAAATITAGDVLRAFRRIPVPASEVSIQPPGGETLVNLDTIFSTEADSFTRTIGLLGHRVELAITPAEFRWVNGDGTVQVTDWAGKPWAKGTPLHEFITHRYEDAARTVQPRVDTTWTARYRVNGGVWQDVGGTVTITGEPFELTVLSAEPHLSG